MSDLIVRLPASFRLYQQSETPRALGDGWAWLALWPCYGESYGAFLREYAPTRDLLLLNLGDTALRRLLAACWAADYAAELSADAQYAGGAANLRLHERLRPLLERLQLDGTIIVTADDSDAAAAPLLGALPASWAADDESKGATEVVLFGPNKPLRLLQEGYECSAPST